MATLKRIPFDSLALACAAHELRVLEGGRLQKTIQAREDALDLAIYAAGREQWVHLSCSQFPRVHLSSRRPASTGVQPPLGAALRRLEGSRLSEVRQRGFDRVLVIAFERAGERYELVAELTGKNANLILVGPSGKVEAAAHGVSRRQSVRPIAVGKPYEPPPFPLRKPIYGASSFEEIKDSEGASPFLISLLKAQAGEDWSTMRGLLDELEQRVGSGRFEPVAVDGCGAYPISVSALGYPERSVPAFSAALESELSQAEAQSELESRRARLLSVLKRVLLARDVALEELKQAEEAAADAPKQQLMGELILAYASSLREGQTLLEAEDYEGHTLAILLDPDATPVENAERHFAKAKKAKARASHVAEQRERLSLSRLQLVGAVRRAEDASNLDSLEEIEGLVRQRLWLREQRAPARKKEERPYEGHRISERLGPNGSRVFFGENAESNDYLTQRVAKPNDIWLHVRGSTSAHVVIATGGKPERVSREDILYAAKIAVQNSAAKHSSYVPVDYTLKKYVRKPKGAKAGMAAYTHEKTVHVEK